MIKDKTLSLKDYRIIKVMLSGRKPLDFHNEIGLPEQEISERLNRLKTMIPALYQLKPVKEIFQSN